MFWRGQTLLWRHTNCAYGMPGGVIGKRHEIAYITAPIKIGFYMISDKIIKPSQGLVLLDRTTPP